MTEAAKPARTPRKRSEPIKETTETKRAPKAPGTTPAKRTPRRQSTKTAQASQEDVYIRNAGGVPVRVRAPRKRGETYDYNLAPRGQRGDTQPVFEEDLSYLVNESNNDGLYELLGVEAAHAALSKQTKNQQHYHPAQAALRDEHGNPITGITTQHEGGGDAVAHIVTPQQDGSVTHRQIQIQR